MAKAKPKKTTTPTEVEIVFNGNGRMTISPEPDWTVEQVIEALEKDEAQWNFHDNEIVLFPNSKKIVIAKISGGTFYMVPGKLKIAE